MHRFFVPPESIENGGVVITGEQAHQLRSVLRLKHGDHFVVLDNSGHEYEIELVNITGKQVTGKIKSRKMSPSEPEIQVTLYQALLTKGKLDFVLQKCTEIGVSRFVPVRCERSVALNPRISRMNRWKKIVVEAAEQSGRGKIPVVDPVLDFKQACEQSKGISFIPWEEESNVSLRAALEISGKADVMSIFIGPEGGFTQDEIDFASNLGITSVTLGKRILRAETAGIAVSAILMYLNDEMV